MNKLFHFIAFFMFFSSVIFAQVGINIDNSTPDPSAGLDVKFNNKGLLPPRMSKAELNAISNPADGLLVYCTNCGSNGLGSLSMYMAGAWYTLIANCMNPISPVAGNNIPSTTQIEWKWNTVVNAAGYKWNITDNYTTAIDMGTVTSKIETNLMCLTPYTRYVWAYSSCGISLATVLFATTSGVFVSAPSSGTHIPTLNQIIWKWNAVAGATGYKWNTSNSYATATDMGLNTYKTETALNCNTNYTRYIWAYNICGNSNSTTITQVTLSCLDLPAVTTTAVTNINQTTATSGGNVTSDGGATVTARGVCWSTSPNPTLANNYTSDGTGTGIFISNITGLIASTIYYVRSYATNSVGTSYGNEISFTSAIGISCPGTPTVTYGGKTYNTVLIGTQCWFKENLNFQTGNSWCYNDDNSNCETYGRLYDFNTAQGVCPTGWHLPNEANWLTLSAYLGGSGIAGGVMKEAGNIHWLSPNTGATNISWFTALPSGHREAGYSGITTSTSFWSSSDPYYPYGFDVSLYYLNDDLYFDYGSFKTFGRSVRCLKNN